MLQQQTNISRKTLERVFTHYLGVHPKLYARIVRFNAVKEQMDLNCYSESPSAMALDYGFYDSSHFISEFKKFSGITPHAYIKDRR